MMKQMVYDIRVYIKRSVYGIDAHYEIERTFEGMVPNFPTLIVCGFVFTSALMSFFSGMILSVIIQKNRQDFEMRLMRCYDLYEEKVKNKHKDRNEKLDIRV